MSYLEIQITVPGESRQLRSPQPRRGNARSGWIAALAVAAVAYTRMHQNADVPAQRDVAVSGQVLEARLIRRVEPVYPPGANQSGVSGTVQLAVVVGKDGTVQDVKVVSGPPSLVDAASDAVRQWVYRPWDLDGQPMEVDSTIDVVFPPKVLPAQNAAVLPASRAVAPKTEPASARVQQVTPAVVPQTQPASTTAQPATPVVVPQTTPSSSTVQPFTPTVVPQTQPGGTTAQPVTPAVVPQTPPATIPSVTPTSVTVTSKLMEGRVKTKVRPVYPEIALQLRVSGTVRFQVVVSKDGTVPDADIKLISGNPMLVAAARDAVRQWVYRPWILDGQAIDVTTDIDVIFELE